MSGTHATRRCTRCGRCCQWPGTVKLRPGEAASIAEYLGLEAPLFLDRYAEVAPGRRHLALRQERDGACVFLWKANVCLIQPVKPAQCVGFPDEWNFPGYETQCLSEPTVEE
jgi:Fe-S-cluster containining protein